ncbi:MAG: hypothetical protein D6723_20065, partial [Acidobacteria bacterium]
HTIVGNTVLYGATGGTLFAAGAAGERFAVRNSGATAVIEGVGDHGCEYMTGGTVVVLGPVGRNFAAGMTGGTAYVLDEAGTLVAYCNRETVEVGSLTREDEECLRWLIEQHRAMTGSHRADWILNNWDRARALFRKVAAPGVTATVGESWSVLSESWNDGERRMANNE